MRCLRCGYLAERTFWNFHPTGWSCACGLEWTVENGVLSYEKNWENNVMVPRGCLAVFASREGMATLAKRRRSGAWWRRARQGHSEAEQGHS